MALLFLAVAIGLCVFEQYTVEDAYTQTNKIIDSAMDYLDKDDYSNASRECKKLDEYWNKKYPCLTAMIEHGALDEAKITISSLEDLANNKSEDLEEELINTKNQIKSIRDNQKISLGNIF